MSNIEIYQSQDGQVTLDVQLEGETVWLTQAQMSGLFDKERSVITRHINNVFKEGELERKNNVQKMHINNAKRPTSLYSLDVIISVGYRVKSQRGVEFRKWATGVLRCFILEGHVENERRLMQLGQIAEVMARIPNELEMRQVLDIVRAYTKTFELLDSYDRNTVPTGKTRNAVYELSYDECMSVVAELKSSQQSSLFGAEKDESFKSSIASIYQSFGGQELYPSLEAKAANLLYFVTKNHSFLDGNKRIAAMMFLYFLDKNNALFRNGKAVIDENMLVAVTLMIAESKAEEKDSMVALVMNFIG